MYQGTLEPLALKLMWRGAATSWLAFLWWHKHTPPVLIYCWKAVVTVSIILGVKTRGGAGTLPGECPSPCIFTLLSAHLGPRLNGFLPWAGHPKVWTVFQDECHNFIKVLLKKNDDTLFVCGTNAFNPSCRNYKVNDVLSVGTTQPGGIS